MSPFLYKHIRINFSLSTGPHILHLLLLNRPQYRDNARVKLGQDYRGVGEQFILLPEPIRYLTDRLVSVNTQVPEIDDVVQISSNELLEALNEVFTLDVFRISYVSVAIRSFIHHFYPAYGSPVVDYAEKISAGDEVEEEDDEFAGAWDISIV